MALPEGQPHHSEGDVDARVAETSDPAKSKRRRRRRRSVARLRRPIVGLTDWLFVVVVVGSVLPIGSTHVPVLVLTSTMAMLAAVACLVAHGLPNGRIVPLAWVAWALAIYSAFQAMPLPFSWVSHLSPVAGDVWARALHPFGEGPPRFASLSLDPGASWVEALKWWTYGCVAVAAGAFGARHGEKWSAVVVLGSAVIVAASTLGHGMVDATKVFGVYVPTVARRGWRIGPLINSNTLAGYLNLGALAGMGLVATTKLPIPRWVLAIAVALVIAVSVNTGSRGGVVALFLGFVVLYPLLRQSREVEGQLSVDVRRRITAAVLLTVLAAAAFAAIAASKNTLHLLLDDNLQKLKIAVWAPPMIRDYTWFGAGRGAFESVFAAYKTADNNTVFSYPENLLVQWATEWGTPVAVLLVVTMTWLLRPRAWGAGRSAAASGLFAGSAALAVQNFVDLGLEVPGVAILATAAIAAALGSASFDPAQPEGARWVPRAVATMAAVGCLGFLIPTVFVGIHTVSSDKVKVRNLFPDSPRDRTAGDEFKEALRASMVRHPAEPYFARAGATFALWANDSSPIPWVQRALERAMTSGRTHYLVARLLGRYGIGTQALVELRLATEQDPDLSSRAARYAMRLTRRPADLMRAVPDGAVGTSMLMALSGGMLAFDENASFRFLEEAVARSPDLPDPRVTMVRRLLHSLEDHRFGTRCAAERRIECERTVLGHIRVMAQLEPQSDEPLELVGRLLLAADRPNEATRLLSSLCPGLRKRQKCLNVWLEASAQATDRSEFESAMKFAERDACTSPKTCAAIYSTIGNILSRIQGPVVALAYYRRAVSEDPSRSAWLKVAAAAAMIGAHAEAASALDHAAAFGATPELQQKRELERTRAMLESLKTR